VGADIGKGRLFVLTVQKIKASLFNEMRVYVAKRKIEEWGIAFNQ